MVDFIGSTEFLKPWSAGRSLSSEFISGSSSLERFPLDEDIAYLTGDWALDFLFDSASAIPACQESKKPRTLHVQENSRDMSRCEMSIGYSNPIHQLPTKTSQTSVMATPMKRTLSGNDLVVNDGEEDSGSFQHINEPFTAIPSNTGEFMYSIPTEECYVMSIEDTSLSSGSNFTFVEMPKQELVYQNLPFLSIVSDANYWQNLKPATSLATQAQTYTPFCTHSQTSSSDQPILSPTVASTDLDQDYTLQIQAVSPDYQQIIPYQSSYTPYISYPETYTCYQPQIQPYQQQQQQQQQHAHEEKSKSTKSNHDKKQNSFLIECKRRGLSYKEIKRIGGFTEAESTLRGRFRTLTKSKEQRVRKPKWQTRDVSKFSSRFVNKHA